MTTILLAGLVVFCILQWWNDYEQIKIHQSITAWMRAQEEINREVAAFIKRAEVKEAEERSEITI